MYAVAIQEFEVPYMLLSQVTVQLVSRLHHARRYSADGQTLQRSMLPRDTDQTLSTGVCFHLS